MSKLKLKQFEKFTISNPQNGQYLAWDDSSKSWINVNEPSDGAKGQKGIPGYDGDPGPKGSKGAKGTLGDSGIKITVRVMGLVLSAIAIGMMESGLKDVFPILTK